MVSAAALLILARAPIVHRDLMYARVGERELKLDLRLPEGGPKPVPTIVAIHGGGWQNGSKNSAANPALVRAGYAVASIEYRLSGEAIFPAQIQDCKAAIRWLRANAKTYGLDANRFGVTGHSAGGHLSSLVGTSAGTKAFDVGAHLDQSSAVRAVAVSSGPVDFLKMGTRQQQASSPVSRLLGGKITEHPDRVRTANPITYIDRKDPPFLLMHGTQDPVVPQSQATLLHDALKRVGIPVELRLIEGGGHMIGGPDVSGWTIAFFDRHLRPAK